ncbi:TPA: hypothetical protein ACGF3W_003595, partial [Vibrio cholerae]
SGKTSKTHAQGSENSAFIVQAAQFGFGVFPDADLVESVERSAVLKPLKTNMSRCFHFVGCSTRKVWFHKRLYHRCDLVFFVADS